MGEVSLPYLTPGACFCTLQTCGLEILYHQAKARGDEYSSRHPEEDSKWPLFLQRLHECGYFSSELEGSARHQEKLSTAKEFFLHQRERKERKEMEQLELDQ